MLRGPHHSQDYPMLLSQSASLSAPHITAEERAAFGGPAQPSGDPRTLPLLCDASHQV